jgi:deoxyribodipyrimidine photolyase-related protein
MKETVWILGDQLMPNHPALDPARKNEQVVLFIEARDRLTKFPYHKQKLTLVLAAMRHYAAELRADGWQVDYRTAQTFGAGLREHLAEYQTQKLVTMAAAEFYARAGQNRLPEKLDGVTVEILPNAHFLVESAPPTEKAGKKLIMEQFYRQMRRKFGVLIEPDGEPTGGNWNYDEQNRKPYKGEPAPPTIPHFVPDDITQQVLADVNRFAPNNIGATDGFGLPVTRADALCYLDDFITYRLPLFGAYEDAMSQQHPHLWHSLLSPLMNIGLLEPLEIVQRAEIAYRQGKAPLNSVEGFIRQIIGWREYMYWRYHQMMPEFHTKNSWDARRPLPEFFWTGETRLNCLHTVISKVLATGYSHHIERLMVLCNFALLAGVNPKEVNDWFLACYFDAYDWVVTPNVIGMGLCADGGVVGTKPYVASAAYINKMSDYCKGCYFAPKERTGERACPYNYLYWNFMLQHEERLRANPRMGPAVLGLRHLSATDRQEVIQHADKFLDNLG